MDVPSSSASSHGGSRPPPMTESSVLYFAYGSNLHLAQMAQRCPGSRVIGKATLPGYRWQINQRGVANVIISDEYVTQGLVYLITPDDEAVLDRAEGVSKDFYRKHLLSVALEPHEQYCNIHTMQLARILGNEAVAKDHDWYESNSSRSTSLRDEVHEISHHRHEAKVLVYVSEAYTTDGVIREEYILRLNRAVLDAVAFGVSRLFVKTYIFPHLNNGDALSYEMGRFLDQRRETGQRRRLIELSPNDHEIHSRDR